MRMPARNNATAGVIQAKTLSKVNQPGAKIRGGWPTTEGRGRGLGERRDLIQEKIRPSLAGKRISKEKNRLKSESC